MTLSSAWFWGLVLVTAVVSFRWGAMAGLIFFVFMLVICAAAVSRVALL